MDTEFEDFLIKKKIDPKAFQAAEKERFEEWKTLYLEVSEASFVAQKKFLINPTRRKYLWKGALRT